MRVLYDHTAFIPPFGGVAKYHVEVMKRLPPHMYILSAIGSGNQYLRESGLGHFTLSKHIRGAKYWMTPVTATMMRFARYDIYHPTTYDAHLQFLPKRKKIVVTVHDLNMVTVPQYYRDVNRVWPSLADQKKVTQRADRIIAVSENTKGDLINYWNIPEEKITTIYHGITPVLDDLSPERVFPFDYILYVGARNTYKNFYNCLCAFRQINSRFKDIKFVCTGLAFSSDEKRLIDGFGLTNEVFGISASEEQMARLYRDAKLFVYPSFYEGFGMPILEAMQNHCPVALSNASCFPEVAKDAAAYFDPNNVDDMIDAMLKIIEQDSYRDTLIRMGDSRFRNFSWEKCAEKHMNLYKTVSRYM